LSISGRTPHLHSFPTRRSSDLAALDVDRSAVVESSRVDGRRSGRGSLSERAGIVERLSKSAGAVVVDRLIVGDQEKTGGQVVDRSEEHTRELLSRGQVVCGAVL